MAVDNYDVFINFRGADTRHGFVKILYKDLVAEGMRVFLDDEELNYGKRLDEELPQAINNSKIYITVISENYASSKWCLRELAEIVRNKQEFTDKKEILPVFYKIKTDDVKLKTDLFKNQLNSLINKNVTAETVEAWGFTLKGIADLKAWKVPVKGGDKEDGECCHEIVKWASIILRVKHKPLPKDLIGMEDPVEEVMQLLDIGNPSFQVIGILGMGGSGKTTLAKVVYNMLCDDFDCCCFMPDVRESLDNDKGSTSCLELQKKLLKEVSYRGERGEVIDVEDAVRRIRLALQGKKVLMVFDDVSKPNQILRLIGDDYTMFGRESRVIITTRDDQVLRNRKFAEFTKIHSVSNDVVNLTARLPLSLEEMSNMSNEEVHESLKIRYEYLKEGTREIFLDIACFFVDKKASHERHMWGACLFYPESAIEELISMCFLKIDEDDTYRMDDYIKDFGRDIVRQEGLACKEQRSRFWKKLDSIKILTSMKKKNNIKGIFLEHNEADDKKLSLRAENFVNLDNLRFLHFDEENTGDDDDDFLDFPTHLMKLEVEGSFKHLLPNLRWLCLKGIIMKRFNVTNFNLKKLVVLNLSASKITESWAGWKEFKDLPSLEVLDLTRCDDLKKTPDLSHCTSLKKLYLAGCSKLEEIDRSIDLPNLEVLDLSNCENLKKSPDLSHCTSLKKLYLVGCSKLEEIDRSIIYLKALEYLDLGWCYRLKELPADEQLEESTRVQGFKLQIPNSIGAGLVNLEHLSLKYCKSLESLPNSITSLPKLHILNLSFCKSLESLPDSVGETMALQLTELDISWCVRLKKLPEFISKQKKLEVLQVDDNREMEGIPTEIEELTCLREISFNDSSIYGLPSLVKLTRLEKLSLEGCDHLQQLPAELPTSLVELRVKSDSLQSITDCSNLINLTELELSLNDFQDDDMEKPQELNLSWIWRLSKLKSLVLGCDSSSFITTIQSEEASVSLLSQLEKLTLQCSLLGTCVFPSCLSALTRLEISLSEATSLSLPIMSRLKHFKLEYSYELEQIIGLGELESLVSLEILHCDSLERLDDISKLRQLQTLKIEYCSQLRVIPGVPSLRSLKELFINECGSLESLDGPSESESCFGNILRVIKDLLIANCPLLENKLPSDLKRRMKKQYNILFDDDVAKIDEDLGFSDFEESEEDEDDEASSQD